MNILWIILKLSFIYNTYDPEYRARYIILHTLLYYISNKKFNVFAWHLTKWKIFGMVSRISRHLVIKEFSRNPPCWNWQEEFNQSTISSLISHLVRYLYTWNSLIFNGIAVWTIYEKMGSADKKARKKRTRKITKPNPSANLNSQIPLTRTEVNTSIYWDTLLYDTWYDMWLYAHPRMCLSESLMAPVKIHLSILSDVFSFETSYEMNLHCQETIVAKFVWKVAHPYDMHGWSI